MPEGTLRGLGGDSGSVPSAGSRAPRHGAGWPPGSHSRGGGGRHRCRGTDRSWTSVSGTLLGWGQRGQRGHVPPCTPLPLPQMERGAGGAVGPQGTGQVPVAPGGPSTAHPRARSCRSWARTRWSPPRSPLLRRSLRVGPLACRAPGHPLPTEEPWDPPRCGDISGTVHRWVPAAVSARGDPPPMLVSPAVLTLGFGRDAVPGGDAAHRPGTPRRARHPGVPPVPREQDAVG